MEVALYVRVSTTRQQQTQTIEQQMARLRESVVTQPEWHLAEEHIYRDDGYRGAKLNRPGLDRLRDRAALAVFERVLMTAPDRLARNYVHQVLLIDELAHRGCQVEFLERPMSQDPHDQLLLQIRGAVAAYERTLIADRMRAAGRKAVGLWSGHGLFANNYGTRVGSHLLRRFANLWGCQWWHRSCPMNYRLNACFRRWRFTSSRGSCAAWSCIRIA